MPNCAIYGCGSCDKHELSLFKLPGRKTEFYVKWKDEILKIITMDRVVDLEFRTLIEKDRVWICEKYFKPEDIEYTSKSHNLTAVLGIFMYPCGGGVM